MNMPKAEYSEGSHACMTICRIVTKEAITTINAGMRTIEGIKDFRADTAAFEHASTARVASPIDNPVKADDVVPRVGHMPSIRTNVGLRRIIPSIRTSAAFIFVRIIGFSCSVYSVGKGSRCYSSPCYGVDISAVGTH